MEINIKAYQGWIEHPFPEQKNYEILSYQQDCPYNGTQICVSLPSAKLYHQSAHQLSKRISYYVYTNEEQYNKKTKLDQPKWH